MPYARPNRTSTTPCPAARRPKRAIVIAGPQNPAATLAESTGTWNFAVRVWLAFDPPSAATPNWIDISGFVEQDQPIMIVPGRADGLSDVNATTCALTVDNSDGRFMAANPNGVWFGKIGKGSWLKVEIYPPSGIVSSRFVGFITTLPNQWSGQYQTGQITASDRFEKLGRAPAIISSIQSEVLTDPNLAGKIQGYWNLHESQGSVSFGDTSGQGAQYMRAVGLGGVPAGTGMGASNVNAPGFDGLRAVTFNPPSTSQGTYLTAPISTPTGVWSAGPTYTGLAGCLSFWYQATSTAAQTIISVVDPSAQFAATAYQVSGGVFDGRLQVLYASTSQANPVTASLAVAPGRIADGAWHHVVIALAASSSLGGNATATMYIDGYFVQASGAFVTNAGGNFTQLIVGGGYSSPGVLSAGAGNISDVSWYWSSALQFEGSPSSPADISSHFLAGSTGFSGETTDLRIARVARYGGVPIPLASYFDGPTINTVQRYNPIQGAWTNLSPGAHLAGTQNMAGRKPLDVMQEAAHTEAMPLYVDRAGFLTIQPSTARQNTTPAWTVNALDLDPTTQVADDFAYVTNQMTITPNGQAAQTVIGATGSPGRLSQAKYDVADGSQATASLNPVEAQSLGLGYIQLRADPPPRLAPLAIEAATTALLPGYGAAWYDAVLASTISTPVRVTSAPAAVGGGNYDCLIEGWTETIQAGTHLFQFNVSAIQGPTYQLDDVVLGHIDTDGSTLSGSTLSSTALTFQVATTNAGSPLWTTNAGDFPFDILIDAEQITISSITGSSSPQTFNASARSVNGVVATHSVGAAVSLYQPLTLAY